MKEDGKLYKILVADDEEWIRKGILKSLRDQQFACHLLEASDGQETISAIREISPDIVLLDVRMPFKSGLEVMEETVAFRNGTKYIVVSGYPEFEYAQKALNLGASGYLLKPISSDELGKAIIRALPGIACEKGAGSLNLFDTDQSRVTDEDYDNRYTAFDRVPKAEPKSVSGCKDVVEQVIQYVHSNIQKPLTVRELAGQFSINPNYFSTLFKQVTGQGFVEYVNTIKIEEACRMLKQYDIRVTQISESLGFENAQYFFKLFRKVKGTTPLTYRKQYSYEN